ncbi:MAG: hypothetical protein RL708_2038 [Bacteroidota bacterium]|jgi:UDP-N-acetylmuramyl pentapeptide phosphotransferase/UDP-N-acetylglucosamine-1-phosphate transferase
MFKNFQQYLLENKPIYYQTKFWQMMGVAIFIWLFSWVCGFMAIDVVELQRSSIRNFYFGSFAVVHIIIVVIVYVIWALAFFKTNAIQHFYPLSKFYHHKLFIQIVVPALLLVSAYYPYTYGIIVHTKLILNKTELINDALVANKAYPFLVQSKDAYNLEERIYPSPFPVNIIKKNDNNEWMQPTIFYHVKYTNHVIDTNGLAYFNPAICNSKTRIEGDEYILYTSHNESIKYDSCHIENYTLVDTFIIPSQQMVKHYRDVLNFSSLIIQQQNLPLDSFVSLTDKDYYQKYLVTDVHQIVNTKNAKAINDRINAFLAVCNKYKIKHTIVPQTITDYLIKNDFKIRYNLTTNNNYNLIYPETETAVADESAMVETVREKNAEEEKYLGYVEFESISNIYNNYNQAIHYEFENGICWVLISLALFLATFIVLAHSVDGVSGLLSIPATGIILLFCGLIAITVHHDESLIFIYCLIAACFIGFGFYNVRPSSISRRLTTIFMLLGFYAIPFFATLLFFVIHEFSKSRKQNMCSGTYDVYGYEAQPMHIILLGILLLFLYLPLLKKLKAKADE